MNSLSYGQHTDTGRVRKMNQDSLTVREAKQLDGRADGLFVVADGMGGLAGGEVASRIAVETLPEAVLEVLCDTESESKAEGSDLLAEALEEGIIAANAAVWKEAKTNPSLRGMGTTCVAVLVRGEMAAVGHVGDSRIYLLRAGELIQLTHDHSLVQEHMRSGAMSEEEASRSRFRNVITRGVGLASGVEPDVRLVHLREGDALLLCSDGLTNMISEGEIGRILAKHEKPQDSAVQLVAAANAQGGIDNITTLVVHYGAFVPSELNVKAAVVEEDDEEEDEDAPSYEAPSRSRPRRRPVPLMARLGWFLLLAVLVTGGILYATGYLVFRPDGREKSPMANPPKTDKPTANKPNTNESPPSEIIAYTLPRVVIQDDIYGAPIACDGKGNVFVVSKQNETLLMVTPEGKTASKITRTVMAHREMIDQHMAADSQGYVYICSRSKKTLEKYAPNGPRVAELGRGKLIAPEGIAVDTQGNVYVVDNHILKVIAPERDGAATGESPNSGTAPESSTGGKDGSR